MQREGGPNNPHSRHTPGEDPLSCHRCNSRMLLSVMRTYHSYSYSQLQPRPVQEEEEREEGEADQDTLVSYGQLQPHYSHMCEDRVTSARMDWLAARGVAALQPAAGVTPATQGVAPLQPASATLQGQVQAATASAARGCIGRGEAPSCATESLNSNGGWIRNPNGGESWVRPPRFQSPSQEREREHERVPPSSVVPPQSLVRGSQQAVAGAATSFFTIHPGPAATAATAAAPTTPHQQPRQPAFAAAAAVAQPARASVPAGCREDLREHEEERLHPRHASRPRGGCGGCSVRERDAGSSSCASSVVDGDGCSGPGLPRDYRQLLARYNRLLQEQSRGSKMTSGGGPSVAPSTLAAQPSSRCGGGMPEGVRDG